MKKLYLCMGISFFLLTAFISMNSIYNSLTKHTLRLHVVANSNSVQDQQLKLKVRDELLKEIDGLLPKQTDKSATTAILLRHRDLLLKSAKRVLEENNSNDSLLLTYGKEYFPNKKYRNLSFPSGKYDAFKIIIGEGKGENWWSVLYPSLCTPAIDEIEDELKVINSNENDILLRFKLMDYYYVLKEKMKLLGS